MTLAAPALTLAFCLVAAGLLAVAIPLAPLARLVPLAILVPTLAALLLQLLIELHAARRSTRGSAARPADELVAAVADARRRTRGGAGRGDEPLGSREMGAIGLIVAIAAAVDLLGPVIAVPATMLLWLTLRARMPAWRATAAALLAFIAVHVVLGTLFEVALPPGRLLVAFGG